MQTRKHILAFGGGLDSTALCLINLHRDEAATLIGIPRATLDEAFPIVDVVMFSDLGAERAATYENIGRMEVAHHEAGVPFVIVKRQGENITQWLLRTGTIPLMPGGSHLCSMKFKTEVMHKQTEERFPGFNFLWSVGIEADEDRRAKKTFNAKENDRHSAIHPLRSLGLDRKACEELIAKLGWTKVVKSSCVFCPFMQEHEIAEVFRTDKAAWEVVKQVEATFAATSPVKHQAWLDARKPVNSAGRALKGMWRMDSWANGARLFARRINGKVLSVQEWEARVSAVGK
jgi:hypothetical protein